MNTRRLWVVGALATVVIAGLSWAYVASSSVTVTVDGDVRTTRTFVDDVAAVLASLEVEVNDVDRIEPALDTPLADGLRVTVTHAKSVTVTVYDDDPVEVTAIVDTVADALRAADLQELLEREARIEPAPDEAIADGDHIAVVLPVEVTVIADGNEQVLETYAETAAEALDDAGLTVGDLDEVEPAPDAPLEAGETITVRRVEIAEEVVEVTIAYAERFEESDELMAGHQLVEVEGVEGLHRETYAVTLVDGQETERELIDEEVLSPVTDRVVRIGAGSDDLREAQQLLSDLGYPTGPVDGIDGGLTRRALCSWRRLEGREVSRGPLQAGELDAIRSSSGLGSAPFANRGVTVDRTCQSLYYASDGRWQDVYAASTGADGLPSPGDYRIQRVRPGWHTSTLYPAPEPNMYNTLYFNGAIAIHGSRSVPTHPASKGCVRVTPDVADRLFAALGVGDPISVIGTY